jgi:hypothetical protein
MEPLMLLAAAEEDPTPEPRWRWLFWRARLPYVHTKAIVYRGRDVLLITDSRAPLGFYGPTDTAYTSASVAVDARTGDLVYSTLPGETTRFQTRRVDAPILTPVR